MYLPTWNHFHDRPYTDFPDCDLADMTLSQLVLLAKALDKRIYIWN